MLLNAGPLNAAAINSDGDAAGGARLLSALLEASSSAGSARLRLGYQLGGALYPSASTTTARLGAQLSLSGPLLVSATSEGLLQRGAGPLSGSLSAAASISGGAALSVRLQSQAGGAVLALARLRWANSLPADPMQATATWTAADLRRDVRPLAGLVLGGGSVPTAELLTPVNLRGLLPGSGLALARLTGAHSLSAGPLSGQALVDSADLSLTHHHLRASAAATVQAQAADPLRGSALSAIIEVEGRVDSSVLEVTNRGRLSARLDAAAYVSGNPPRSRRLSASIQAFGFLPFSRLNAGPDVSGLISAAAIVPRAALSNGRNFDGLVLSHAEVSATTSVHVGLFPANPPKAQASIPKSVLKTNFERLFASADVAATVEEATLDNGVKSLKVYAETRAVFLYARLETSEKLLSARIEFDSSARDGSVDGTRFEPLPRPPLRASLHCALDAVGELRGGALLLQATLSCGAQATGAWGAPPDLKNLRGLLHAQADAAAQIRTSRAELRGLVAARATTFDRFDKWPDIRLLKGERIFATATRSSAHLHSPIHLLFAELLPTADVERSGLGYVVSLAGTLTASASVDAVPLVSRRLYGHIGATSGASGYVINRGVLQALFNDAIAEVAARPHVGYSLTASAPCGATVRPNMQLRVDFTSAPVILAAVNGRLSAHYRGVDVEGSTSTFAEVSADSIYAEVEPSLVEYRKAA